MNTDSHQANCNRKYRIVSCRSNNETVGLDNQWVWKSMWERLESIKLWMTFSIGFFNSTLTWIVFVSSLYGLVRQAKEMLCDKRAMPFVSSVHWSIISQALKTILLLCPMLVRPPLKNSVHFWRLNLKKNAEKLKRMQRAIGNILNKFAREIIEANRNRTVCAYHKKSKTNSSVYLP